MIVGTVSRRLQYCDYYQDAVRRILALGISQIQIEALREFGLLACDNVTRFHEGRSGKGRISTLKQLIHHVEQTGEEAFYVEMDVRNLGGLNAAFGHTRANDVFLAMAEVIRKELSSVASEAVFFRHGGDELSAFLVNTTEQAVETAIEQTRREVAQVARDFGVQNIPNPKNRQRGGVGIHFGIARITAEHKNDPSAVFREADTKVEGYKRHSDQGEYLLPRTEHTEASDR